MDECTLVPAILIGRNFFPSSSLRSQFPELDREPVEASHGESLYKQSMTGVRLPERKKHRRESVAVVIRVSLGAHGYVITGLRYDQ